MPRRNLFGRSLYVVHAVTRAPRLPITQREQQTLTDKELLIHDQGIVSLLPQLHDDLDAAIFAAYGLPASLTDAKSSNASYT
jgi:hypothetical protein